MDDGKNGLPAGKTLNISVHQAPAGGYILSANGHLDSAKTTFAEVDRWFQEIGSNAFNESLPANEIPPGIRPNGSIPPPIRKNNGLVDRVRSELEHLSGNAGVFLVTAWLGAASIIGA